MKTNRTIYTTAVLLLGMLLPSACGPAGGAPGTDPAGTTVIHASMAALAFTPATIEASVGDTIVWRNDDLVPHTVDAIDNKWTSGLLEPQQEYRYVVTTPGRQEIKCLFHPVMKGEIVAANE